MPLALRNTTLPSSAAPLVRNFLSKDIWKEICTVIPHFRRGHNRSCLISYCTLRGNTKEKGKYMDSFCLSRRTFHVSASQLMSCQCLVFSLLSEDLTLPSPLTELGIASHTRSGWRSRAKKEFDCCQATLSQVNSQSPDGSSCHHTWVSLLLPLWKISSTASPNLPKIQNTQAHKVVTPLHHASVPNCSNSFQMLHSSSAIIQVFVPAMVQRE